VTRNVGPPDLDVALLDGFRYACRPGCGLCCFATPRATEPEILRLRRIEPALRTLVDGRDRVLAARDLGGACQFLSGLRCRVHEARPHPCREFPLTVHVGERLQATVVLSCPGVEMDRFASDVAAGGHGAGASGFETELSSLRSRVTASTGRRIDEAVRRRRRVARQLQAEGRWMEEDEIRDELRKEIPFPADADFPVDDPPNAEGPLEELPLYFDHRKGPVVVGSRMGAWEAAELAETGGARPIGFAIPASRRPRLTENARELLRRYLEYCLQRDSFLAGWMLDTLSADEGDLLDWTGRGLRELGATVLARADFRARLARGPVESLSVTDVALGVRATDQEWLDRPTWGDRL